MQVKTISLWVLGVVGAFLAFVAYNIGDLVQFALTKAKNGEWPVPDTSKCPVPDFDAFSSKLLQTPRITVKTLDDCFKNGEAMNHPLVCRLEDAGEINSEAIVDAILSDDTIYKTVCREEGDYHYVIGHTEKNQTLAEVVNSPSGCGAGFIYGGKHTTLLHNALPVLDEKFETDDIKNLLKEKGSPLLFGTSFISNFKNNRISTGSHSAMVVSMALQLVGKKKWIMHSFNESKNKYWYGTIWVLFPNCVADFLKNLEKPYYVETEPGDVLYFPIAYQHLVYTEEGTNLMLNIRTVRIPTIADLVQRLPLKAIATMIAVILLSGPVKASNPRIAGDYQSVEKFYDRCRDSVDPKEHVNIRNFVKFIEKK